MNPSTIDIESVVREVLAQLAIASAPSKAEDTVCRVNNNAAAPLDAKAASATAKNDSVSTELSLSTLTVSARVVTLREIADRLPTTRRLVVSREAIVTPAVRDELLRRGIDLQRADDASKDQPAAVRLVLSVSGTDFDPTALAAALSREGFRVECSASDCLIAAVEALAAELAAPDTLGVLLTKHVAAGLCLANRLCGVRAIGAATAPEVAAAAAAVGANMLVVDPRAGNFHPLKQMISEFGRGGARPCPEVFRKQLA